MGSDGLMLGATVDGAGERTPTAVHFDPADLTTHGVIVGMTGSGKTGLGIVCLEEVLRSGIPALILDPKGDMTNLLLGFPDLAAADFEPWIDPAEERTTGSTRNELAAARAEQWRTGLESWDLDGADVAALHDSAGFTIYTPGSSAGRRLDIVGSLSDPGLSWDTEAEALREQIQGFSSGLLGLLGIDADPITSREHILISNLVEHAWRNGTDLDLATLLAHIQRPPIRKLGVFEVDAFYPEKDRTALARKLNGLLASPAFAEWVSGAPLDIEKMLWDDGDRPQAAIIYLAHLSDEERQFIVTLVLSKVITWMRSQAGTSDLRALVYMDEVFGFVPPTAEPPAKRPILTLLKQARAFGVGMLLSTQNPVDLDYKAMSNAATWFVGRLQTERDKARIVEALRSVDGQRDVADLDRTISALGKRQFVLHSAHIPDPVVFTTRWALSYLAGPLTREQIVRLRGDDEASPPSIESTATTPEGAGGSPPVELADDETGVMPAVAEGVGVRYLDTSAPWAGTIGADATATTWQAMVAARTRLVYDDRVAGVDHSEEWETVVPLGAGFDPGRAVAVDYDDRDLLAEPPGAVTYRIPDARIGTKTFWSEARSALSDHLAGERTLGLLRNPTLKLYSRPGEPPSEFADRCDRSARENADAETAKLRGVYERKLAAARKRFEAADRRVDELETDVGGARQGELIEGAGLLIDFLSGRSSTRTAARSGARRRAATESKQARLQTAQDKALGAWEEMAAIDAELATELEQINDRWEAAAGEIEEIEVGLERSDVHVDDLVLVWVPHP